MCKMPIVTGMQKNHFTTFLRFSLISLCFLCVQHFLYAEQSIVTVHQAQRTESKKSEDGHDLIVFSGDVYLTIEKGDVHITISADRVNFDRERDMLYASDNVVMTENNGDNYNRTLNGNSLLMNTSSLEGVFDEVQLTQKQSNTRNLSSETTMIVSSEVFSREEGGTIVFKKARLTFCDDENPHWQLRSSRMWLLPGTEFAFFNALLYVGRVPVLYLPFFYYPKDEMIFNPVFGYRPRVGYYTQTTTYLIGRKPLPEESDEGDGLFNFAHPSQLMEQRREGLFLRNLDTPLSDYSSDYLKVLGDVYSNLGAMMGVQGEFAPKDSYFKKIAFTDLFAVSRNLYKLEDDALYSPKNKYGISEWNKSVVFGKKLPFRFAAGLEAQGSSDHTTFNISLPFYSDPFFKADFLNRSEHMDWINYVTSQGISTEAEMEKFEDDIMESYSWKINGSISPDWGRVSDYFNLRITSIASSLDWASKQDKSVTSEVSTDRQFFYPSQIVPLSVSASVTGTLFSYPRKKKEAAGAAVEPPDIDLETPGVWTSENEDGESGGSFSNDAPFPVLAVNSPSVKEIEKFKYSLDYSYTPNFTSLYSYSAEAWPNAAANAWKDYMSNFIAFSGDFRIASSAVWYNGFAQLDNDIVFSPSYQHHPEISEKFYPTVAARNQVRQSDYMARKLDLSNTNTLKFKPFILDDYWYDSYIAWTLKLNLIRTEYIGKNGTPAWKYNTVNGSPESIPEHNITSAAIYKNDDITGSFTLITNLPPQLPKYEMKFAGSVPHFSTKMESGIAVRSREDPNWDFMPFVEEVSVNGFDNKFTMSQSYKYLTTQHRNEYLNFSAAYNGFSVSYSRLYTTGFKFDNKTGWKSDGEERFRSYQGKISYESPAKSYFWWGNRIGLAPSLSTALVWDFLRPPLSYFTFSPALHFRINDFIEIKFSSEHRNDVVFRYFQGALGYEPKLPGETNLWQDLMDSFNFAEYDKRKLSGFKLKSLSLEMNHNLHDWDVKSKFKIEPRLLTEKGVTRYDYSPYISVSVVWKPMTAMQSNIVDEYGSVKLNP